MVSVDTIIFWTLAIVAFAGLSLLAAPDSRDSRRTEDRVGSWAPLAA